MLKTVRIIVALLCAVLLFGALPVLAQDVVSSGVVSGAETSSVASDEEASSAVSGGEDVSSVGELEFADHTPAMTLPEAEKMPVSVVGVIGWAMIFAAMLGVALFVYAARSRNRRAFRSRSAARSRWQRLGPVRSGMSEKLNHDNSHMRR